MAVRCCFGRVSLHNIDQDLPPTWRLLVARETDPTPPTRRASSSPSDQSARLGARHVEFGASPPVRTSHAAGSSPRRQRRVAVASPFRSLLRPSLKFTPFPPRIVPLVSTARLIGTRGRCRVVFFASWPPPRPANDDTHTRSVELGS
jgi:hypothetical protein